MAAVIHLQSGVFFSPLWEATTDHDKDGMAPSIHCLLFIQLSPSPHTCAITACKGEEERVPPPPEALLCKIHLHSACYFNQSAFKITNFLHVLECAMVPCDFQHVTFIALIYDPFTSH